MGLSSPTACGIAPDQGLNPRPLYCKADSLPLDHQGSPKCLPLRESSRWPEMCSGEIILRGPPLPAL